VVAFNRQLTDPEGNNYKASPSSGRTVAAPPSRRAAGSPGRPELGAAIVSQLYDQLNNLWS
jgi:hypothetical protein